MPTIGLLSLMSPVDPKNFVPPKVKTPPSDAPIQYLPARTLVALREHAEVRDVDVTARGDGHAGREDQALGDERRAGAVRLDAEQRTGRRPVLVLEVGADLEHEQTALGVERHVGDVA